MNTLKITAITLASSLVITACSNSPYARNNPPIGGKTEIGTLLGAAGGAVAGAQFGKGRGRLASVAIGTLLGAAIGNQVGDSLDKSDILYHQNTLQNTLTHNRTGKSSDWHNPDNGNNGEVTITKTYQHPVSSRYCREFNHRIQIGGKWKDGYGTACRQPDGSWEIQS